MQNYAKLWWTVTARDYLTQRTNIPGMKPYHFSAYFYLLFFFLFHDRARVAKREKWTCAISINHAA